MIRFSSYEPSHIFALDAQPAQKPWLALGDAKDIAHKLAAFPAWTGFSESGEIVGCAGIALRTDRAPWAWAIFSPLIARFARPVIRFVRQTLDAYPADRIMTEIYPDHPNAAPFARRVGFEFAGVFQNHPSGIEGVALFERIRT